MTDPIAASSSLQGARLAQPVTPASKPTHGGASFAGELARYVASSTGTTAAPAPARPKTEKTEKVAGHPYALVANGSDKGKFLNQLDGSPREGKVFKLVERDDRVFHVYGAGKEKVVVEVKSKAKADATPAQPTGGTAPSTAA
jgi:hypothetical protein